MTKHLSKDEIRQIMDGLMHQHSEGRNADAPELSLVSDTWHENWKQTFPDAIWFQCDHAEQNDHAEQLMRSTSLEDEEDMIGGHMGTGWVQSSVKLKQ